MILTAVIPSLTLEVSLAATSCRVFENPPIEEIFQLYPKLYEKAEAAASVIQKAKDNKYFDDRTFLSKESNMDLTLKEFRKIEPKLSETEKQATLAVIEDLYNVDKWIGYTKTLYLEAAMWIHRKGSDFEKSNLQSEGLISRRSMLAVLAQRARDRGETVGKVSRRLTDEEFLEKIPKGPFIDKAFRPASPHGQLPHWFQMDYVSGTLRLYYGNQLSEFYKAIIPQGLWAILFDGYQHSFASPLGFHEVMSQALPLFARPN